MRNVISVLIFFTVIFFLLKWQGEDALPYIQIGVLAGINSTLYEIKKEIQLGHNQSK